MLFLPYTHDTNGQIIYYACVYTLKTKKTQDDISVYMAYAHMGRIKTHIRQEDTHMENGKVSEYTQAYTRRRKLPEYMQT